MEGPAGLIKEAAVAAEQAIENHHRITRVNASALPARVAPAACPRPPRLSPDQIRGTCAQCRRRPPDTSSNGRQLPSRRVVPTRGCDWSAIQHRVDETREDTLVVWKQTGTADRQARHLRRRIWLRASPQDRYTRNHAGPPASRSLADAGENAT